MDIRADSTPSQAYLDANIGDRLTGVAIAMLPITAFFLALRFYSRYLTRTPWGLDDALAAVSGVIAIGLSALAICQSFLKANCIPLLGGPRIDIFSMQAS